MMNEGVKPWDDFRSLTTWTQRFLYLQVIVTVIALISGAMEHDVLSDISKGVPVGDAAENSDFRQGLVAVVQLLITLVSGILILRWIYKAKENSARLGASGMTFTPGWAIGWYFIPFMNLWKPYRAMQELWRTSMNPANWQTEPVPRILGWWWFSWIVANMLGNVAFRVSMRAQGADQLLAANVISQLADAAYLPLCVLLSLLIGRIYRSQIQRAEDAGQLSEVAVAAH